MVGEHHENCATPTAHLVSPLPPVSPLPLVSPGLPRAGSPDFDDEHPIKHRAQHQKRSDLKSSFLLAFHPANLPLNLPPISPNVTPIFVALKLRATRVRLDNHRVPKKIQNPNRSGFEF